MLFTGYLNNYTLSYTNKKMNNDFEEYIEEFKNMDIFKVALISSYVYLGFRRILTLIDAMIYQDNNTIKQREILWLSLTLSGILFDILCNNVQKIKLLRSICQTSILYFIIFDQAYVYYNSKISNDTITSTGYLIDPVVVALICILTMRRFVIVVLSQIPIIIIINFYLFYYYTLSWPKGLRIVINSLVTPFYVSLTFYIFEFLLRILYYLKRNLENHSKQLAELLKSLPNGFAIIDDNDKFLFADKQFLSFIQIKIPINQSLEEIENIERFCENNNDEILRQFKLFLGEIDEHLVPIEMQSERNCLIEKIKSINTIQKDIENNHFNYSLKNKCINYKGKDVNVIILVDITDSVNLEIEKLQTKSKSLAVAGMTHDMRTPLMGMISQIELLISSFNDPAIIEICSILKNTTKFLLCLVNDALDVFQINENKITINFLNFNVRKIVSDAYSIIENNYKLKGIKLYVKIDEDTPEIIKNDEMRFERIILNLLGNALKFTSKGFVKLKVSYNKLNHLLFCKVKDTCIGIKDEDIPKLFQPFMKLQNSTNINLSGAGIGLSVCQNLSKLMGGEITVKSTFGKGSTFVFSIMDAHKDENEEEKKVAKDRNSIDSGDLFVKHQHTDSDNKLINIENNSNGHNFNSNKLSKIPFQSKLILIVDDDPLILSVYSSILSKNGYQYDKAYNGMEALEKFKNSSNEPFSLIILDAEMPIMNGFRTLIEISKITKETNLKMPKIIICSGNNIIDKQIWIDNGATEILMKPLSSHQILQLLSNYL